MEFFTSVRGARKLIYQNFIYCKNKTLRNGSTYWECSERRNGNGCKAKLLLDEGDNLLNESGDHTPNPDRVRAEVLRSNMKRDSRNSNARTNVVVSANIGAAEEAVMANLPRMETMLRDVRRQRQTQHNYPAIPQPNDTTFMIPNPFTQATNGGQFLWYDNGR